MIIEVSLDEICFNICKKCFLLETCSITSEAITTINKSLPGIVFGKFAAEYILNLIPKNTHDWNKFISPNNLYNEAKECGILLNNFVGFVPDLVKNDFKLSSYLGINYAASGMILK